MRGVIAASILEVIDIVGRRIDVDEYRHAIAVPDGICGGDIGMTDRNHFVAGLNADRQQREMKSRRTI